MDRVPTLVALARAAVDDGGSASLAGWADRLEGRSLHAVGDAERSVENLLRARRAFIACGSRWEAACVELELAEALTDLGRREAALQRLGAAIPVLHDLHAVREASRATEVLARIL